ncbi:MAG: stalk domain-containing protein, partial [Syntrophomonas sp.]|nr:stalk domain-containing protein [Syntrophomonas sp.]
MVHKKVSNWRLLPLIVVTLIMLAAFPSITLASTSVFSLGSTSYYTDGNQYTMNTAPYAKDNRTYMPIRYIAYALGISDSNIIWDGANNTVTLMKGSKVVQLKIGRKSILINGASITMDVAPEIGPANRTMLPAALVAQAFGASATWNPKDKSIIISNDPSTTPSIPTTSDKKSISQPLNNTADTNGTIPAYEWDYKSQHWKWDPQFSEKSINKLLAAYHDMPHPHHSRMDFLTTYCIDITPTEEELLSTVANCFKNGESDDSYNEYDIICNVIAFVQSFTYISDSASTGFDEYPRYPLETLFTREGDCEDTSILIATLIRELGYGTAL